MREKELTVAGGDTLTDFKKKLKRKRYGPKKRKSPMLYIREG
jgi:hypothetical protein